MTDIWNLHPRTAPEFADAVERLRETLDEALQAPEPGEWDDRRGEFWTNWKLGRWVEASHAYRADSKKPVDAELLGTWQTLLPEGPGGSDALRSHFASVAEWARIAPPLLSPDAWERAFDVLYGGAVYE